MYRLYYLLSVIVVFICDCGYAEIYNMTQYRRMPPLYLTDFYDSCLDAFPEAEFCLVNLILKPVDPYKPSVTWKYIEKHNADYRHYRYDHPQRGICLHWCQLDNYRTGSDLSSEFIIQQEDKNRTSKFELSYRRNDTILNCVNQEFQKFGILAELEKYHCEGSKSTAIDDLDWTVAALILITLLLVLAGTIYDWILRRKKPGITFLEHYKKSYDSQRCEWIICFSVCRNWIILTSVGSSEEKKPLRCIQGMRFFTMLGVLAGHSAMLGCSFSISNPEYIEKSYAELLKQLLFNGHTITQVFLGMGGFLMAHGFIEFTKNHEFHPKYYFLACINRWIRLTPAYAMIIALGATWGYHLTSGPYWESVMGDERRNCRNNWWSNLLYINNYYKPEEACVQQGWYLAADTQCFIVGMLILTLSWRYPKLKKSLLSLGLFLSFFIPGFVTYVNKLSGVPLQIPENERYLLLKDKTYLLSYIPGHCNGGSYMIGILSAHLYQYLLNNKIDLSKKKWFVFIWWTLIPLGLALIFSGYIFYADDYQYNVVLATFYAAFYRGLYGLLVGIFVIGCAMGIGWFARGFLTWGPLQGLGRLTYCAYLYHVIVLRLQMGTLRQPFYAYDIHFLQTAVANAAMAYMVALIVCLGFELPVSAMQRIIFLEKPDKLTKEIKKNKIEENNGTYL